MLYANYCFTQPFNSWIHIRTEFEFSLSLRSLPLMQGIPGTKWGIRERYKYLPRNWVGTSSTVYWIPAFMAMVIQKRPSMAIVAMVNGNSVSSGKIFACIRNDHLPLRVESHHRAYWEPPGNNVRTSPSSMELNDETQFMKISKQFQSLSEIYSNSFIGMFKKLVSTYARI